MLTGKSKLYLAFSLNIVTVYIVLFVAFRKEIVHQRVYVMFTLVLRIAKGIMD